MGRFSTTIQIFNSNRLNREQFITEFVKIMDSVGYFSSSSENDYDISYFLIFQPNGKWITVGSNEYKINHHCTYNSCQKIAEKLQTKCFSIEVVDSDWAEIKLFSNSTNFVDEVIVGRCEFDENPPKGKKEFWENLLEENKKWSDIFAVWNKDEVFVEDALYEAASLLGIESKYMVFDFIDFENRGKNDPNIVQLFFKKINK